MMDFLGVKLSQSLGLKCEGGGLEDLICPLRTVVDWKKDVLCQGG